MNIKLLSTLAFILVIISSCSLNNTITDTGPSNSDSSITQVPKKAVPQIIPISKEAKNKENGITSMKITFSNSPESFFLEEYNKDGFNTFQSTSLDKTSQSVISDHFGEILDEYSTVKYIYSKDNQLKKRVIHNILDYTDNYYYEQDTLVMSINKHKKYRTRTEDDDTTRYTYDKGLLVSIKNTMFNETITVQYDSLDRVIEKERVNEMFGKSRHHKRYEYYDNGLLKSIKNESHLIGFSSSNTIWFYDNAGNTIRKEFHRGLSSSENMHFKTILNYSYDSLNLCKDILHFNEYPANSIVKDQNTDTVQMIFSYEFLK